MNPGSLLINGMNSFCTRRAASSEFVTPSYRRTVKYALLLILLFSGVIFFFIFFAGRGPALPPYFRLAKLVKRLPIPGLFQRPASTSRAVRHGNVHRCPTGKVW